MSETQKVCPLLVIGMPVDTGAPMQPFCIESKCAFWTTVYTTENIPTSGCAITLLAGQNSDGRQNV